MRQLGTLLVLCAVANLSCGGTKSQTHVLVGDASERVSQVARVLSRRFDPPSAIENARLMEEQLGEGGLGSSDFRTFLWLKVAPADVARWRAAIDDEPLDAPPYVSPPTLTDWWISQIAFGGAEKFDSWRLFGHDGWIAVQEDGNIFVYTNTR